MTEREHADVSRRNPDTLEKRETSRWLDIGSAIVLALATMASAWCGYQSALWSGVQTFRLEAVSTAGREAAAQSMKALELRGLDASMFINYVEALGRGDTSLEDFLHRRFRPEMRKALDAWLKTDPLHNPHAPLIRFRWPSMCSRSYWKRNVNRGKPRRWRPPLGRPTNSLTSMSCSPCCSPLSCSLVVLVGHSAQGDYN